MKYLIIAILLLAPVNDINRIAKKNELKKEAKVAYENGDYKKAIETYHFLLDSMGVDEDAIRLNLANAYYNSADTTSAVSYYDQLTASDNNNIASVAYQQRGIIKNKQKKHKPALEDFKLALRKDPYNEAARYNYELLKKLLNEQKEQDQQQKQDQEQDKKEDQEQK
ncbi:MAG: tetratricopeptide repeat protein, partial [Candidatus Cyclobacteriaceae bacterium M2_1C_046]